MKRRTLMVFWVLVAVLALWVVAGCMDNESTTTVNMWGNEPDSEETVEE